MTLDTSGATSYQYSVNNTSTPKTFCITATTSNVSYYQNNTAQVTPASGGCPGHGQNGVAPITNLVANPSAENNFTDWGYHPGTGATATFGRSNVVSYIGSYAIRLSWNTSATAVSGGGSYLTVFSLSPNTTYSASVWVRSSKAQVFSLRMEFKDSANALITTSDGPLVPAPANQWTLLSYTATSPANTDRITFTNYQSTGATIWTAGDTMDTDGFMVTTGSVINQYADGNTANWVWNGTPGNSTSTGPAL